MFENKKDHDDDWKQEWENLESKRRQLDSTYHSLSSAGDLNEEQRRYFRQQIKEIDRKQREILDSKDDEGRLITIVGTALLIISLLGLGGYYIVKWLVS
jgi:chromosome segregation ATPase